jgi:hypothetical protein
MSVNGKCLFDMVEETNEKQKENDISIAELAVEVLYISSLLELAEGVVA